MLNILFIDKGLPSQKDIKFYCTILRKSTIQRIGNTSYLCEKHLLTDCLVQENGLSNAHMPRGS